MILAKRLFPGRMTAHRIYSKDVKRFCGSNVSNDSRVADALVISSCLFAGTSQKAKCKVVQFDAKLENEVVGSASVCMGRCYVRGIGLMLEIDSNDAYVFHVHVKQSVRRCGVFAALHDKVVDYCKRLNGDKMYMAVDKSNNAMRAICARYGYLGLFDVVTYGLLSVRHAVRYGVDGDYLSRSTFFCDPQDVYII